MKNVTIRDATPEDASSLGLIMTSAFFGAFLGVIPERDLDLEWTPAKSANNWRRYFKEKKQAGESLILAEVSEERGPLVAGLALAGRATEDSRYPRSVTLLFILPTWQRRGIGRHLLASVASRLIARNEHSLMIGCVKENPNRPFYIALGGREYSRIPGKIDRFVTEEVQYVWDDISVLCR